MALTQRVTHHTQEGRYARAKGRHIASVVAVAALVLAFAATEREARAAFNPEINYQGKLLNASGSAVADGTYHMKFRLYTQESGGTAIFEEDRSSVAGNRVPVTNGLFSVMLGSSSPLTGVDFNQTLWLEVSIGGTASTSWETLSPRKRLGAVPAAFEADKLDGVDSTQFLRSDQSDTFTSGTLTFNAGTSLVVNGSGQFANATATDLYATTLGVNGEYFTDLTGTGLAISSGALTVSGVPASALALPQGNVFRGNASNQAEATSSLYITNAGDVQVGISLRLPDGSAATPSLAFTNDTNTGLYRGGADILSLVTGGSDRITVNATGDITLDSTLLTFGQSGNSSLTVAFARAATTTVANGEAFAYTIATSTTADPLFRVDTTGSGEVIIGSKGGDVYIGDVGAPSNLIFEEDSAIHGQGTNVLTFGVTGDTIRFNVPINGSSTATSTFDGGINLRNGCFAINGTCISGGSGGSGSGTVNSGTQGQIAFYPSSGTAVSGTSTVFVTSASLVGVGGTTSPFTTFTVAGDLMATGRLYDNTYSPGTNGYVLQSTGTGYRWVATSTLGLGSGTFLALTDTPSTYNAGRILFESATGVTDAADFVFDSANSRLSVGTSSLLATLAVRGAAGLDPLFLLASSTDSELLRVTPAGYLGIGTSTPAAALSVAGDIYASSTGTSTFTGALFIDDGAVVHNYGGDTSITNLNVGPVRFEDNAGWVSWIDLPVTAGVATGTVEAFSAQVDSLQALTVWSETVDGDGTAGKLRVVVGTTSSTVLTSTNIPFGSFIISDGALCVDNSGGTACDNAARTSGQIYAKSSTVTAIDVAENFPVEDTTLRAGEIAMLDSKQAPVCAATKDIGEGVVCDGYATATVPFITRARRDTAAEIVGVISTDPGLLLGGFGASELVEYEKRPVALKGRVPVVVNFEGGDIAPGDRIALSSVPGVGTRATTSGRVVGFALEGAARGSAPASATTSILMYVEASYYTQPSQFAIDAQGRVGIGTTSPYYTLQVEGSVAAHSFVNISTEKAKKDIAIIDGEEKEQLLDVVRGIDIAQYRYLEDGADDPLRLGLIAEKAPLEVLSVATTTQEGALLGVDLYKLTTLTLAGVQELADTVSKMELRLQALEQAQANATTTTPGAAGGSGTDKESILQVLADMGMRAAEGILRLGKTAVATLTVGSPEAPSGITLYDEATGAPYCLKVKGGQAVTESGACAARGTGADDARGTGAGGGSTGTSNTEGGATSSAPVVTLIGTSPVSVALGEAYIDQGVSVTSPSGAAILGITLIVDGTAVDEVAIDTSATGTHVITYTATDEQGRSDSVERVVIVGGADASADAAATTDDTATDTPDGSSATSSSGGATGATGGTTTPENADGNSAAPGSGAGTEGAGGGDSGSADANAGSSTGADNADGARGGTQGQEAQGGGASDAAESASSGSDASGSTESAAAADAGSGTAQEGDGDATSSAPEGGSATSSGGDGAGSTGEGSDGANTEGSAAGETEDSAAPTP